MDSDNDTLFQPPMTTAEMLNTFETDMGEPMQETDNFFSSALATDSSERLFSDDGLNGLSFQTPEPIKMQTNSDSINAFRTRQPISISPASSVQDSSSESSGHRKRKSSSKSSQSGLSAIEGPMANTTHSNGWNSMPAPMKPESTVNNIVESATTLEDLEFNNRVGGELFDFDSAGSSPSQEISQNPTLYSGPRHVAIQYQDSPISNASFPVNSMHTRDTSPMSNSASSETRLNLSQPTRPSPLATHEEYNLLRGMQQRSWPFGEEASNGISSQLSMAKPLSSSAHQRTRLVPSAVCPPSTSQKPTLIVHPTPTKSRVETQIPIKLTMIPLPKGVTKLHLPPHTISKPKLLVKPSPSPSPDTLELETMLVCTSAMQDPMKLQKAFVKAANRSSPSSEEKRRLSAGDRTDKDDEEQPLNGGEVRICEGCIVRERKRAARKKSKKPEEEEPWQAEEAKRVVVFNTNEIKEWQPSHSSNNSSDGPQEGGKSQRDTLGFDLPEGAMQVEIPMRIACYCRHQNEKVGFQVILTIKDYQGRLVSQGITQSIVITDDHKTHPAPGPMQPNTSLFGDQPQMMAGPLYSRGLVDSHAPGLYRNAHSTTDLQSLQQGYCPQFMPQAMAPYAVPNDSSQTTSNTMTPRNLSRQASPSAPGGPLPKKRKASGGAGRVPSGLMMTSLHTHPTTQGQQWNTPPSASSAATSPYTPTFPQGNGLQSRSQPHHAPQRSGHFNPGPQTAASHEIGVLSQANRSESFENFSAMPQMYSAPPSTLPSRAPSPSGGLQMASTLNTGFGVGPANALFASGGMTQQRQPVIHKLIPKEGPKAGGIEVTCLGEGFYQGIEVTFGDACATTTTYWSESSLECLLPPAVRAGPVSVMFKHQLLQQQQAAQFGRFPSPAKSQTIFTYVDDDEQELMRQALMIVSQKMRGDVSDAGQVARWIVNGTSASTGRGTWIGSQQSGGYQRQVANVQTCLASALDCEGVVLKCLELIDLDESPFPARLNLRKQNGQTLLHLAASLGYHRLVAGLLARGANPDCRDKNGMSPMHMAALNGHAQIVRRLRVSGGDSTMRSLSGFTPADMATSRLVLDAVETINLPRSRSVGPTPLFLHSRTNSSCLVPSAPLSPADTGLNGEETSSEQMAVEESDTSDNDSKVEVLSAQKWARSRRNSAAIAPDLAAQGLDNNHGYMFAIAAMATWRDQITTQLQQIQQTVNFTLPNLPAFPPLPTLPPMPNLPDYQAYPMMRRFSSFVPHRNSRPSSSSGANVDSKENDSRWWEFLRGGSSPPSYEEIYPQKAQEDMEVKTASAARAAADAAADKKCSVLYDAAPAVSHACVREPKLTARQEEELSLLQRKNVKRLRSDRKLFFIWIPLLVLVVAAMLKERVPELWRASQSIFTAVSERYHRTENVAAY